MNFGNKYSFQISSQECDFREQISLPALGDIILQAAGKSADENGFGMQKLNMLNRTWVVSRMAIEMTHFPKWRDEITIETWVEIVGRAATSRHFRISNAQGQEIGGASSLWAMIDVSTRKAVDLKTIEGLGDAATGSPSLIEPPQRLSAVETNLLGTHQVVYSDIDFNRHTNSMKYVEWLLDSYPLDWHQKNSIKRFEINFLREVLFGETVYIFGNQENGISLFEIKTADNSSVCKMKLETYQTL